MKKKGVLKGVSFGIVCSLVIPFLFSKITQMLAGGQTSFFGESWLYLALSLPLIITLGFAGYYLASQDNVPDKKMWIISILLALIVSLFAGTLGTLLGELVQRGNLDTMNVEDSMKYGIIYSFVFLPITVPVGKFILNNLNKWITPRKTVL